MPAAVTSIPSARPFDPQLAAAIVAGVALVVSQAAGLISSDQATGLGAASALVWLSLAAGSIYGVRAAWRSIRELRLDIDILMVVGAGLSAFIGHPAEGALLLFMFTLAGALEHRALAKAKDAVSRLTKLMPAGAMVWNAATNAWESRPADSLAPGDEIQIKPGETVPADAVIIEGRSELDTSTLTGESLPRAVTVGDEVFAGTINQSGSLRARVARAVKESSLQRILQLVIEAQERRQPVQRMIDRLSTPYTVGVFALSIVALVWFHWGQELAWDLSIYRAITLLIVASPCALVIATPTVTLCGLSRAARSGLLIKGGDALERLAMVRTVAMDKTGTLTVGKVAVNSVRAFGDTEQALAPLALGIESHSTHPIAEAFVKWAASKGFAEQPLENVQNLPGLGLEGYSGAAKVRVGRLEWALELVPASFHAAVSAAVDAARRAGSLTAVAATSTGALVIELSDLPRPGADRLVQRLRDAGITRVAMLTGDHHLIAERVANELGIEVVHAELLPEQKVERLRELKSMPGAGGLALVGDGINDAPALALADVGLAMGGIGAGAALEAADVIVLHDDLDRIPWAFALAHRVRKVMIMNLTIAVGVIVVLASLALLGKVPLGAGVVGHEGSTLVVVGLSLTVLWFRGPAGDPVPATISRTG